jgi:hypothetical protein
MKGETATRQRGAFVYTGSGKKQSADAPPEQHLCKVEACAIQRCLAAHNHQERWCEPAIKAWKECCDKVRASDAAGTLQFSAESR